MKRLLLVVLMALGLAGGAQAALVGRDINGNAVAGNDASSVFLYDTTLNVTWLRDANANGQMNWTQANAWAAGLTVGGYSGWRLPTMISSPNAAYAYSGTDAGYNVRTTSGGTPYSEMASLWYDTLGNKAYYNTSGVFPQPGWGLTNTGDFKNLQGRVYWSGLEYAPSPTLAWYFNSSEGGQLITDKTGGLYYALAVRSGDVAPAVVPIPAAAWLLVSGIGALGAAARWRKAA